MNGNNCVDNEEHQQTVVRRVIVMRRYFDAGWRHDLEGALNIYVLCFMFYIDQHLKMVALLAVDIGRVFVLSWLQFVDKICLLRRSIVSLPLLVCLCVFLTNLFYFLFSVCTSVT
jgi:hypothetical protein